MVSGKLVVAIVGIGALTSMYVACSEFSSAPSDQAEKLATLARGRLFGTQVADADKYMPAAPPENGQPVQEAPQAAQISNVVKGAARVHNLCSNVLTGAKGYNLKSATAPVVHIQNAAGQDQCSYDGSEFRNRIMSLHRVSFADLRQRCPNLATGNYFLSVTDTGKTNNLLMRGHELSTIMSNPNGDHRQQISFEKDARDGSYRVSMTGIPWALADKNDGGQTSGNAYGVSYLNADNSVSEVVSENIPQEAPPAEVCEARASPLMVQISDGSSTRQIRLTPPTHGIFFDILGERSEPSPHTKTRISWYSDAASASYNYWIVLPNANGQVLGIDQMFGDNTKGPDGSFAANGFEALRKWDGRMNYVDNSGSSFSDKIRDGRIDSQDPVFSQLKLWFDRNLDGMAQADELIDLSKAGVESIDLNFDPNFAEIDIFGNEIKFKSVMRMRDGRLNIVYDLWFRKI